MSRSPWPRRLRFVALGLSAWLVAVLGWSALRDRVGQPDLDAVDAWHEGHRIVDRNGAVLRELTTDYGRRGRPLSLDEIGPRAVTAAVVAEDADFFEHDGIDRLAILRAAAQNVANARVVSGASTITQQLVKLLDTRGVTGRRTLAIKIDEAARAQNLETQLSKGRILVEYMNRLPYGHGLVGPEAAAQAYFGVPAHRLSWAQAAFLAVLPRAPSSLDPYAHFERVVSRQQRLLTALHEHGHLDDAALQRARVETIAPRGEQSLLPRHDALEVSVRIERRGRTGQH
ncbi:MAG: biosynthetic peptidoglycan transglycosylase, partial [Myxococcota bacterium]